MLFKYNILTIYVDEFKDRNTMKRVLITGKGSYIGTKVEEWLKKYSGDYLVDVIDMIGENWKNHDFHSYDSVYHVAGIAHRKDAPDELYEEVNHLLAVDVAKRAAEAGVKQFIFMSSGAVYSQSDKKHPILVVDEKSTFDPCTEYGRSKLRAEQDISKIESAMKVAVIRPPMVYGPCAKGNYNSLSKIAQTIPIFPDIENTRSMIYIDNLCEFIRLLIDSGDGGIYLPQNKEFVNVSKLAQSIAKCHGKKLHLTKAFNWTVKIGGYLTNAVNKVFGDFYYKKIEYFGNRYQVVDFEESIERTEA